jgi:hypothetical protein
VASLREKFNHFGKIKIAPSSGWSVQNREGAQINARAPSVPDGDVKARS